MKHITEFLLRVEIVAVNQCWIDAKMKNGQLITFIFKQKPNADRLHYYKHLMQNNTVIGIRGIKTDDPDIFTFAGTSRWGAVVMRSRANRQVAIANLRKTIGEDKNYVRAVHAKSVKALYGDPLINLERFGNTLPQSITKILAPATNITVVKKVKPTPEETSAKLSASIKKKWEDPDWKANQVKVISEGLKKARERRNKMLPS
jgi:hypothetical protein